MIKKFIFNADDFGLTKEHNQAVVYAYNNGFLTSASLCANGEAFEACVNDILPECNNLGLGVHLNIIEGKALTNCDLLTDSKGNFNKGYLYFILNSFNKKFLKQVEDEFRAQIEKILSVTCVDHIDSHVHTHAIPNIFDLTCRLAKEYDIKYVRTQHERFYLLPDMKKYFNISFGINIIKVLLLNTFTFFNRKTLKKYELLTNDFIIGVGYTGMMNSETLEYGLKALADEEENDFIAEALIHPCLYKSDVKNSHTQEFSITVDKNLEDIIKRMEFDIVNYKKLL